MDIAGPEPDFSDFLAAIALLISTFLFWTSRTMAAANKSMARAAEESARTAREAVEHERRESLLNRKACLTMATDQRQGGASYRQDMELGTLIEVHVRNEGMAAAYDVTATLTFDDIPRDTVSSDVRAISSGEVATFDFTFFQLQEYDDMPVDFDHSFVFRTEYRDGVGADTLTIRFRLQQSTHPHAESGHPYWDAVVLPADIQVSELCRSGAER